MNCWIVLPFILLSFFFVLLCLSRHSPFYLPFRRIRFFNSFLLLFFFSSCISFSSPLSHSHCLVNLCILLFIYLCYKLYVTRERTWQSRERRDRLFICSLPFLTRTHERTIVNNILGRWNQVHQKNASGIVFRTNSRFARFTPAYA